MQKAPVLKGSGLKPLEDTASSETTHVFGRNLEERVVTNVDQDSPSISFSAVQSTPGTEEDDIDTIRKRKFDAITGEEDEETIFQGDFKLFVWSIDTSNWVEKGRGHLKLNDSIDQDKKRTRLIMRVNGTLRIILNISIRHPYFRVLANSKTNMRFTDGQTVWGISGSSADHLKDLIDQRLKHTIEETNEEDKEATEEGKTDEDTESNEVKKTKSET